MNFEGTADELVVAFCPFWERFELGNCVSILDSEGWGIDRKHQPPQNVL